MCGFIQAISEYSFYYCDDGYLKFVEHGNEFNCSEPCLECEREYYYFFACNSGFATLSHKKEFSIDEIKEMLSEVEYSPWYQAYTTKLRKDDGFVLEWAGIPYVEGTAASTLSYVCYVEFSGTYGDATISIYQGELSERKLVSEERRRYFDDDDIYDDVTSAAGGGIN